MSGKLNLTNEEQLWIMAQVKNKSLSLDAAESVASIMTSEKDLKKEFGSIKRSEQKRTMSSCSTKAFTFSVIRFPVQSGIKNSMQIDFRKQSIYFMDKITIHIILPFSDIIGCSSDKNDFGLKLQTKHSKIRFFTNTEHKAEIERLISIIIQQNELEMILPVFPSFPSEIVAPPMSPNVGTKAMIMTFINERKLLKEGIIEKKVNSCIVRWSERILRVEEREFSFYEPNKKGEPLGVVQINRSTLIEPINSERDSFVITVGKTSHYFRVKKCQTPEETEGERDSWILAFREACNQETFTKYWMKNRSSFLYQDNHYPMRSPSPPADYDEYDGGNQSHFKLPVEFEMKTIKKPVPFKKVPVPHVPDPPSPVPKIMGPQNQTDVPEQNPSFMKQHSLSSTSPSSLTLTPKRSAPPPPGPPPPPLPPAIPGLDQKSKITLKAHCKTKLKHFFVPKVVPKVMNKTIWMSLRDVSPKLDFDLLKEYFTDAKQNSDPESFHRENKRLTYMAPKKAQNILILMKSNQFLQTVNNLGELINSIEPPDDAEIDVIRTIQKYQPTKDEIELFQKMTIDQIPDKADKIMAQLSLIPCLQKRLELILNVWTFGSQYEEFIKFLKLLMTACNEISNSKKFPQVMEYLLAILNVMNTSGTSNPGSATPAFHLKFLSQLKNINNARGFSLIKMLVSQIEKNSPELLDFHKEMSTVMECEKMSVKAIHANIEVLKQDLKSIANNSKMIQSMISNPTTKEKEFFLNIKDFYKVQQQKLDSTVKETDEIQRSYTRILNWFGLPTDTFSEELFQYLISFMEEFIAVQPAN